ncbi:hypothetical protein MYX04_12005, partial [Nitrospiraceae bacterium AH_259_D15_M11_P09]|nr:hypothetical protein [Nitrospiraceae bacterium AH_259_D15_M11_P09]
MPLLCTFVMNGVSRHLQSSLGSIPFTPAVQLYYAFDEALTELLEEGVPNRIQRYRRAAAMIRQQMQTLGLKPLLPPELQSNTITSYYLPGIRSWISVPAS